MNCEIFIKNMYLFQLKDKQKHSWLNILNSINSRAASTLKGFLNVDLNLKWLLKRRNSACDVDLVPLLFTLNIFHTFSSVYIVDFEQLNLNWMF